MSGADLGRWYLVIVGVALIAFGLLGFVDNPLVGEAHTNPLFVTGAVQNIIHLATGALALYLAFGLTAEARANGLIAFGALYLVIVLLTIISPNLWGILGSSPTHDVTIADHLLHVAVGVSAIAVGWLSRPRTGLA